MYPKFIKRLMDFVIALLALIILSPILMVIAVLVRTKLGSPVIFRQERPGYKGEIFSLYKFRTMTDRKGEDGELLPDEQRMTRFGNLLRASSLDELPELWNMLRGEMSLVGPRPLLVEYLPLYTGEQMRRHDVRPGLTGLAQVRGRNALTWEEKFSYDLAYVDGISFGLDVRIFFETFGKLVNRHGVNSREGVPMPKFTGSVQVEEETVEEERLYG